VQLDWIFFLNESLIKFDFFFNFMTILIMACIIPNYELIL